MTTSTTGAAKRAGRKTAAAPRSRPAAKAAVPAQPSGAEQPDIDAGNLLNLDAIKHEAAEERFRFVAGGRTWYLRSPEELDWLQNSVAAQASAADDLRPVLRLLLAEQYEEFVELPLTLGQVGAAMRGWQKHHGITVPESDASPES